MSNIKTSAGDKRGDSLEGLITIGDIATSYMEVYDNNILANSDEPSIRNIVKTLDGMLITGNRTWLFPDMEKLSLQHPVQI